MILLLFSGSVGVADYDQFLVFDELQYWNANLFGLAKQWSPLLCGGLSIAGEPQVPFASLTMLLSYLLGPLAGIIAGMLVYLSLGWLGGYLYAGLWLTGTRERCLAASLFIGNGFFVCRIAHGHIDFIPFLIVPLALWVIHVHTRSKVAELPWPRRLLGLLLLSVLLSVSIDGSPVSIIYMLVWIGLYAGTLAWVRREPWPVVFFVGACVVTAVLDAGYLWPMVSAQSDFPRTTADTFTGPWSLLWFLLLPHRGKVLPSNGTGIELSVFIGPFLALLIWRYREILRQIPAELRVPLAAVSIAGIWLGMGSLHSIGLPVWLSPFDWLRSLPGFRSVNVTGRYWGFLALPLSLAAAAALFRYAADTPSSRSKTLFLGATLLVQLVFEAQSVSSAWWHSRPYTPASLQGIYTGNPQSIERAYLPTPGRHRRHHQGEFISPTRSIINCYDMDGFLRAPVDPGTDLIREVEFFAAQTEQTPILRADFLTWNRIRIMPVAQAESDSVTGTVRITLNQAFNSGWSSPTCRTAAGRLGNLVLECTAPSLTRTVELTFFDPVSDLGARVSVAAWGVMLVGLVALGLLSVRTRRRVTDAAPLN